ncbi:MAG: UDP-N-acetylglucosamine 2-epimerase [Pseudolysinimonas sp.]
MSATTRNVAILTGTRADYGLLRQLAREVEADPRTRLQLVVSGTHLSDAHGSTVDEVRADGLPIAAAVPIWHGDDSPLGAAADTGAAIAEFARTLDELRPDVVVVLGDRLEAFAMATAATVLGIPVAHVHGGELTEGAMDDALRHAITKLSYLHFVTTAEHRARVLQLGEEPDRVFDVGAPALDALGELRLLDRDELTAKFGIRFGAPTLLLTFHPAAFDSAAPVELLQTLLAAIDDLPEAHVIVTGTNSDIGSDEIRKQLDSWVSEHPDRSDYVESFGQLGYLSTMAQVDMVVGNSSSTVLEAPLVGVPSVLVGDRQAGRPISASVLTPAADRDAILRALRTGLAPEFRSASRSTPSVFGTAGFARRTLEVLAEHALPNPPRKKFWNL